MAEHPLGERAANACLETVALEGAEGHEARLPFVRDIEHWKTRSGTVKINLALAELPEFTADPGFDPAQFLEGARFAFEMVVAAFAAGDKDRLRPLLSDDVYQPFAAAIDERTAAGETLETRIIALKRLDITEAGLAGRLARVTVKFVSDQINMLRAHDGSVVDGDPDHAIEKTDFWSFARDTRSSDPNWVLVATASG